MKINWTVALICATAVLSSLFFYLSVLSVNATILQAAAIAGDKMSPRLAPTEHTVSVDGTMLLGNRKGGALSVGMTVGKGD